VAIGVRGWTVLIDREFQIIRKLLRASTLHPPKSSHLLDMVLHSGISFVYHISIHAVTTYTLSMSYDAEVGRVSLESTEVESQHRRFDCDARFATLHSVGLKKVSGKNKDE